MASLGAHDYAQMGALIGYTATNLERIFTQRLFARLRVADLKAVIRYLNNHGIGNTRMGLSGTLAAPSHQTSNPLCSEQGAIALWQISVLQPKAKRCLCFPQAVKMSWL
jgi:hypothetical protein